MVKAKELFKLNECAVVLLFYQVHLNSVRCTCKHEFKTETSKLYPLFLTLKTSET